MIYVILCEMSFADCNEKGPVFRDRTFLLLILPDKRESFRTLGGDEISCLVV